MEKLEMGHWYLINAYFYKHKDKTFGAYRNRKTITTWERIPIQPTRAMFIGYRTVADCVFRASGEGHDYDESLEFKQHHHVFLFVLSSRENPTHVLPDDVIQETAS